MVKPLVLGGEWHEPAATYRIRVLITKEEEGGYSAIALDLPGAASCGRTEEEALANFREAIQVLLETYLSEGKAIPWRDSIARTPRDAKLKSIAVSL